MNVPAVTIYEHPRGWRAFDPLDELGRAVRSLLGRYLQEALAPMVVGRRLDLAMVGRLQEVVDRHFVAICQAVGLAPGPYRPRFTLSHTDLGVVACCLYREPVGLEAEEAYDLAPELDALARCIDHAECRVNPAMGRDCLEAREKDRSR